MFLLALRTAMRMREIYTLTHDQVNIGLKTIHLRRTKSGDRRNVPLNSEAREILSRDWLALRAVCGDRHLLRFWQGNLDPKHLTDLPRGPGIAPSGNDGRRTGCTNRGALCGGGRNSA